MEFDLIGLGPQIHVGSAPPPKRFVIQNDWHKPKGGYWTSSFIDDTCDWIRWTQAEQWRHNEFDTGKGFLMSIAPDARIINIDSFEDLTKLLEVYPVLGDRFGTILRDIDFVSMKRDGYAGLHLTREGQWRTRHTRPSLYGWDCESTVFLCNVFLNVRSVKIEESRVYNKESNSYQTMFQVKT